MQCLVTCLLGETATMVGMCRYEGEFSYGFANGLGQYMAANGEVYRGEWMFGKRHGCASPQIEADRPLSQMVAYTEKHHVPYPRCGALIDMKPFHKKVDEGMDPEAAWQDTKAQVEKKVKYGTWATDFFVSGPEQSARFCHIDEIRYDGRQRNGMRAAPPSPMSTCLRRM